MGAVPLDSYLEIAEQVLKRERRPMTPRGIMTAAYRVGLVPSHLFGKTQHKTLGARISEDILKRRDQSVFFRTKPGKFFVRDFLSENTIPEEYRIPFTARRRSRDLANGFILYAKYKKIQTRMHCECVEGAALFDLINNDCFIYSEKHSKKNDNLQVWSFICVLKDDKILTFRLGRYRDDRDSFVLKRSIGFKSMISMDHSDLFNRETLGIVDAGIAGATMDLDIPLTGNGRDAGAQLAKLHKVILSDAADQPALLVVALMTCPDWFEPLKRRLALNDMSWLELPCCINDMEDFDPWSQAVLRCGFYPCERQDDEGHKATGHK